MLPFHSIAGVTMETLRALPFVLCIASLPAQAGGVEWLGKPELYAPDAVSTPAANVRLAISPDGRHELWGAIGAVAGKSDFDIYERVRKGDTWSAPQPAPFNSDANDFDPAFALDGSGVWFFSNRAGGQGGDDIWFVPLAHGQWGTPVNAGAAINTSRNEWAPSPLAHDCLLYSSDGHGGAGGQDLWISCRKNGEWSAPQGLAGVDTEESEYDATMLEDGRTLIFTRSPNPDEGSSLWLGVRGKDEKYTVERLPDSLNSPSGWNFGPSVSVSHPGVLFYSSHWDAATKGRTDIYSVRYRLAKP